MEKKNQSKKSQSSLPGIGLIGCVVTGIAGIVHAFMGTSGAGLIAAALSFGVIVYVSFC